MLITPRLTELLGMEHPILLAPMDLIVEALIAGASNRHRVARP